MAVYANPFNTGCPFRRCLCCRCCATHTTSSARSARHTCSVVTSGFFFPQPVGLLRHEGQHHLTQSQVPQEPQPTAPLVVPQPQLVLAQTQAVFHVPTPERHPQQPPHARLGR